MNYANPDPVIKSRKLLKLTPSLDSAETEKINIEHRNWL